MVHMFNLLRPPCFNLPVLVNLFSSAKNCVPSTTVWKDKHVEWLFSKHYKLSFLKTYKIHIPIVFTKIKQMRVILYFWIEMVVECMSEIAGAAPDLPFFYYCINFVTGIYGMAFIFFIHQTP